MRQRSAQRSRLRSEDLEAEIGEPIVEPFSPQQAEPISDEAWKEVEAAVRAVARILVPQPEVDDLVGVVMLELWTASQHSERPILSPLALAKTICRRRARNVLRELTRRRKLECEMQRTATDMQVSATVSDTPGTDRPNADRQASMFQLPVFRGCRQRRIAEVLRDGGSVADALLATGLETKEFNRVAAGMLKSRQAGFSRPNSHPL
ncbi:MAG: sigma-70 family RNA polymerase sigma factor [Planctomycetes bacterium]|nr:sigma-70 family RNA polymerase sigma factor [Planctomycetota bacterium]